MTSTNEKTPVIIKKESFLWWRHEYYRSRWKQWYAKWLELADAIPADHIDSPAAVLARLKAASCDPDVVLRLAFLEASHKPATQSELAKDNPRQQRLKRKLRQSRDHLWKTIGLVQESQSKVVNDNKGQQLIKRKQGQYRNHVLKAAVELEQALSEESLIFIGREDIDSLRALADTVKSENVDSLKTLADMCNLELQELLSTRALEPEPGHELFALVSYVRTCSGGPNFPLINDLLALVYEAHRRRPPTREAIEKQVQRFAKRHSLQSELIEKSMAQGAKSEELSRELQTCYPAQPLR